MALTPALQRQGSGVSNRTGATSSAASTATSARRAGAGGNATSSRARDLLRNYYGLGEAGAATASSNADALNLDSPNFSAQAYLQNLLNTSSLAQLLRASTTLSASISDLESERQALVYNHHHELIDASITISKMKVRAESLDTTLEQLKAGLSRCSEVESGLRSASSLMTSAQGTASSIVEKDGNGIGGHQDDADGDVDDASTERSNIDWDDLLSNLLDLPTRLALCDKDQALRLWGTFEPVLRKWHEQGVQGVDEIEKECRDVLANANLPPDQLRAQRERAPSSASSASKRRSASIATLRPASTT